MGQLIKVDDAGQTARRQFKDPRDFIGRGWKPFARRDENIFKSIARNNPSSPVIKPYNWR